jgi:hypothetical protein
MHAPSDKRSEDEIVADIIKCVKCPPEVAPFIQRIVRRLISDLSKLREPFTGNQKDNIKFAEKLRSQITKLEDTLKGTPSAFPSFFLFEERFWQIWANAQETPIEINANTRSYIAQERLQQNHFAARLNRLRVQCDEIIKREPGIHGGIKYQHRHAAIASFVTLQAVADFTRTELQLTCSSTSKFVETARLFHEAATDKENVDLRRACEALRAELRTKK